VCLVCKVTPPTASHSPGSEPPSETYDVKYVLGGSERNVRREFLSEAPPDMIGDNDSEGQACESSDAGECLSAKKRQSRRQRGSPRDEVGTRAECIL